MMTRKLFTATGLAGLLFGITCMGNPEKAAAISWFGVVTGSSFVCFVGEFKGGSTNEGELLITLRDVEVQTRCFNPNSSTPPPQGDWCQAGEGNVGTFTVSAPAVPSLKEKGVITAEGCIELTHFDHHFDLNHIHTCLPSDSPKIEIEGTAHIPKIVNDWVLVANGKVIRRGSQVCFWKGLFLVDKQADPPVCRPETTEEVEDGPFGDYDCPENFESKK